MRIRKSYYPIFTKGEETLALATEIFCYDLINNWILLPHWKKCLIKWRSNIAISICCNLLKFTSYICSFSYRFGVGANSWDYTNFRNHKIVPQKFYLLNKITIQQSLPISLKIEDVIKALYNRYKEETGIDITFSKELKKTLKTNEINEITNQSRQNLNRTYKYLIEIVDKLKLLQNEKETSRI